jgi:hypothetical protein
MASMVAVRYLLNILGFRYPPTEPGFFVPRPLYIYIYIIEALSKAALISTLHFDVYHPSAVVSVATCELKATD